MIQFDKHIFQMGWFNHQLAPQNSLNLGLGIIGQFAQINRHPFFQMSCFFCHATRTFRSFELVFHEAVLEHIADVRRAIIKGGALPQRGAVWLCSINR